MTPQIAREIFDRGEMSVYDMAVCAQAWTDCIVGRTPCGHDDGVLWREFFEHVRES